MRPKDVALGRRLDAALVAFHRTRRPLPGIVTAVSRDSLVEQLVESIRRIRFITLTSESKLSSVVADPASDAFDPIKTAVLRRREGRIDDAFWLIFLSVHFGKHRKLDWQMARDVYGGLNDGEPWHWERASAAPHELLKWIGKHQRALKPGGVAHFGNHRKYLSLSVTKSAGTGAAIESYIRWVGTSKCHVTRFAEISHDSESDPRKSFDAVYQSLNAVVTFGRMAKFDYLTMLGKLALADIEPGSAYMTGATGPLRGARLLFSGSKTSSIHDRELDSLLVDLEAMLRVGPMGMQVMEDALCNWQKSPDKFQAFRG